MIVDYAWFVPPEEIKSVFVSGCLKQNEVQEMGFFIP